MPWDACGSPMAKRVMGDSSACQLPSNSIFSAMWICCSHMALDAGIRHLISSPLRTA